MGASPGFWSYVEKGPSCWNWKGARTELGYGLISVPPHGRMMGAHRVAWALRHGAAPNDMFVCHKCDNPSCVNPDHLFLGTNSDNMRDCVAKGRHGNQWDGLHCKRGHLLTAENRYTSPSGGTCCAICKKAGRKR